VTLTTALRCMTTLGFGMALAMALAQDSPTDKNKSQAPEATVSKPESAPVTPSEKEAGFAHPAVKAESATPATPSNSPAEEPTINSHTDKISYASGVDLARDLKQSNSMNVNLFMRALSDALAGRPLLMTDEQVTATMKDFEAEQKQDLQHAKTMVAERNRREGEAFFAENAKKEGVVTLPSGLQYKILKKGDGKIPTLEDIVLCNYRGTLLDGTEVDSSYRRKEPTAVPVKGVIPGWTQALQIMPVGSKWQMFIPPQLAYGARAAAAFGPNATLIFEVELLSVQEKPQTASAVK
jgi:FKBP-type peptidyl-prolyl cis-trans isomerase